MEFLRLTRRPEPEIRKVFKESSASGGRIFKEEVSWTRTVKISIRITVENEILFREISLLWNSDVDLVVMAGEAISEELQPPEDENPEDIREYFDPESEINQGKPSHLLPSRMGFADSEKPGPDPRSNS